MGKHDNEPSDYGLRYFETNSHIKWHKGWEYIYIYNIYNPFLMPKKSWSCIGSIHFGARIWMYLILDGWDFSWTWTLWPHLSLVRIFSCRTTPRFHRKVEDNWTPFPGFPSKTAGGRFGQMTSSTERSSRRCGLQWMCWIPRWKMVVSICGCTTTLKQASLVFWF